MDLNERWEVKQLQFSSVFWQKAVLASLTYSVVCTCHNYFSLIAVLVESGGRSWLEETAAKGSAAGRISLVIGHTINVLARNLCSVGVIDVNANPWGSYITIFKCARLLVGITNVIVKVKGPVSWDNKISITTLHKLYTASAVRSRKMLLHTLGVELILQQRMEKKIEALTRIP